MKSQIVVQGAMLVRGIDWSGTCSANVKDKELGLK
jgi:hypothetical protein